MRHDFDRAAKRDAIPAKAGEPIGGRMCERKTNDIIERDGYDKTGYVLMKDDPAAKVCVSNAGAVAWFTRDQWHWLMFNRDHVEFDWPKPIGAKLGGAALTDEAKERDKVRAALDVLSKYRPDIYLQLADETFAAIEAHTKARKEPK
jgi:hypothetical protein